MKKGRKIFTLFLSLVMIMLIFSACDINKTQEQSPTPSGSDSSLTPSNEEQRSVKTGKVLVAYFSRVGSSSFSEDVDVVTSASLRKGEGGLIGNTQVIADMVHKSVGGDVFQIVTVEPYPSDYEATVQQAKEQRDSRVKPALNTKVENMDSYDVVYLGYPIWGMTIPAPIESFLSEYDFSGKTIVPFATHGGYGLGSSITAIKNLSPTATVLEAFAIEGKEVETAQEAVSAWVKGLDLGK